MRKKVISCLLIVAILYSSLPAEAKGALKYKDVSPGHWAYTAISDLSKRGVIKGYPQKDGSLLYKGNSPLTRYEFASALEKLIQNLEEEMVVLITDRPKVEHGTDLAENLRKNEAILTELKKELATIKADSKTTMDNVTRLQERIATLESRSARRPLLNWLVFGTTVVAVTALVVAVGKK